MLSPSQSRATGTGAQSWMTDWPQVLPGSQALALPEGTASGAEWKTGLLIKALVSQRLILLIVEGKGQLKNLF